MPLEKVLEIQTEFHFAEIEACACKCNSKVCLLKLSELELFEQISSDNTFNHDFKLLC